MIIAIDGPAGAGKGTLANRLAEHFGLAKLDTGLLYRAVGMKVVRSGSDPENEPHATIIAQGLTASDMEAAGLRTEKAGSAASKVAVFPGVRNALLKFQRNFATNPPGTAKGAILDGRDIGTVVCSDADVKFFITAVVEVRAERRYRELLGRDGDTDYDHVLEDMKIRDARDQNRNTSPLLASHDACKIDTSGMDADTVFYTALDFVATKA
jgi:cytidylate kinase